MAISPNTNFLAGAVLTNEQQNRFPRGIMAFNTSITSDTTITTEEVQIVGSTFVAVTNRFYKITYYEPTVYGASTPASYITLRIRKDNIAGTILVEATPLVWSTFSGGVMASVVISNISGTTNFVATAQSASGTDECVRSATKPAYLLVEDIGTNG